MFLIFAAVVAFLFTGTFVIGKCIAEMVWSIKTRDVKEYTPLERPEDYEAAKRLLMEATQDEYSEMMRLAAKICGGIQLATAFGGVLWLSLLPREGEAWKSMLAYLPFLAMIGAGVISQIKGMEKTLEDTRNQVDFYYETQEKTIERAREYVKTYNEFQLSMGRKPRLNDEAAQTSAAIN